MTIFCIFTIPPIYIQTYATEISAINFGDTSASVKTMLNFFLRYPIKS